MKVTFTFDNVNDAHELTEVMKLMLSLNALEPMSIEMKLPPVTSNGSARKTADEARRVSELDNAHVEPYDKVLKDIQQLVGAIEEAGLRTRKEIVNMLQERGVKKFTDLEIAQLTEMRDQFVTLIEALKED